MTREEAVRILEPFRNAMIDQHGCPISDVVFALDVAIKSLEAWDKVLDEIEKAPMPKDRMSFFADGTDVAISIIQEHLEEVEE